MAFNGSSLRSFDYVLTITVYIYIRIFLFFSSDLEGRGLRRGIGKRVILHSYDVKVIQ